MPTIIETKVYKLAELDDKAKERAREWYREGAFDFDWYESTYDDAATCAEILGIDLRQKPVKLMNGSTRYDPAIYFSGFWSQGDGACFEGSYSYAKGSTKKIRKHAPTHDREGKAIPSNVRLAEIADKLAEIQKRHGYALTASVRQRGHYSHEGCTEIEVSDSRDRDVTAETRDEIAKALRDFMRWIYRALESEYEYQSSDSVVDDSIEANEYTFTETGRRFG